MDDNKQMKSPEDEKALKEYLRMMKIGKIVFITILSLIVVCIVVILICEKIAAN